MYWFFILVTISSLHTFEINLWLYSSPPLIVPPSRETPLLLSLPHIVVPLLLFLPHIVVPLLLSLPQEKPPSYCLSLI